MSDDVRPVSDLKRTVSAADAAWRLASELWELEGCVSVCRDGLDIVRSDLELATQTAVTESEQDELAMSHRRCSALLEGIEQTADRAIQDFEPRLADTLQKFASTCPDPDRIPGLLDRAFPTTWPDAVADPRTSPLLQHAWEVLLANPELAAQVDAELAQARTLPEWYSAGIRSAVEAPAPLATKAETLERMLDQVRSKGSHTKGVIEGR